MLYVFQLESKCFRQQERLEDLESEVTRRTQQAQQQEAQQLLKAEQVSEPEHVVMAFSFFFVPSKQLESAERDKKNVIGKLGILQEEQRKLIDQVTDREKRIKELLKVIIKKAELAVAVYSGCCNE